MGRVRATMAILVWGGLVAPPSLSAQADPQPATPEVIELTLARMVDLSVNGLAVVLLVAVAFYSFAPVTADRLFGALKEAGVSVTLISQASSEHSICIAVPNDVAERARTVVSEAFAESIQGGDRIALRDLEGVIIATLDVSDIWTPDKKALFYSRYGPFESDLFRHDLDADGPDTGFKHREPLVAGKEVEPFVPSHDVGNVHLPVNTG